MGFIRPETGSETEVQKRSSSLPFAKVRGGKRPKYRGVGTSPVLSPDVSCSLEETLRLLTVTEGEVLDGFSPEAKREQFDSTTSIVVRRGRIVRKIGLRPGAEPTQPLDRYTFEHLSNETGGVRRFRDLEGKTETVRDGSQGHAGFDGRRSFLNPGVRLLQACEGSVSRPTTEIRVKNRSECLYFRENRADVLVAREGVKIV